MKRVVVSVALAAFGAAGGVAQAASENWLVPLSASLNGFSGESGFTYTMPLFDQQGGMRELTGVEITGSAMFATSTQVFNSDFQAYSVTVPYSGGFTASLPSGVISAFQTGSSSQPAVMPNSFASFSFLVEGPVTASVGNLSAFTALHGGQSMQSGTFTGVLTLPPIPGLSWSTPTQLMGGSLSITYTYNVVPAPGSALAMWTCGVALQRRRRR